MTSATITEQEVPGEKFINKSVKQNGISDKIPNGVLPKDIGTDYNFKREIVWFNAIGFLYLHFLALYGLYLAFSAKPLTYFWFFATAMASGQGTTMGAHRYFSHRTFKAHFIVRVVLIVLQTMAGQNCLWVWVRDHRQHHKYSDTDADPHNANRGFFFSHMGWLMSRKHPLVIEKGKNIVMSDLEADPIVMFQKKYYKSLYMIFSIAIPVAVPVYFWDETYQHAFFVTFMLRYILILHFTWLVNSAAHLYGTKPYDETMKPVESKFVAIVSAGEGWHNYHHVFPWDYRASELGFRYNFTTIFIDCLAYFGLIYDRKSATDNMIEHRCLKAGDGSHPKYGSMRKEQKALEINKKEINENTIINPETITKEKEKKMAEMNFTKKIEETNTIYTKEPTTQDSTILKRNVKEKNLLYG